MPTIATEPRVLTLINVFTVDPARQQELVDALVEVTRDVMVRVPGFISANFHKSFDGRRVVNYAQWQSREHFEAMLTHPEASKHIAEIAKIATYDPILCEVVSVTEA